MSSLAYATEYNACNYSAKPTTQNNSGDWQTYDNCAIYLNGKLEINPDHFTKIAFSSDNLAPFWTSGQMFYLKPNGDYLPVITYDNGPDEFQEGLVRRQIGSKIAYYNKNFEQVLAAKYDWGWPFSHGRALVCRGCTIQPPDGEGHRAVTGGLWGYVDHNGTEIIPVKYSHKEVYQHTPR